MLTVKVYVEFPSQFENGFCAPGVASVNIGEGACNTVTVPGLVAVPFGLVTLTFPVPAELAVAVIVVELFTTKVAAEPAIITALTLVKFVPDIVICPPVQIWLGIFDVIVGS